VSGPRWLLPLAFALVVVAVTSFRPAATPGPFLRDFEAYWSAGSAWNARTDPYGRAIWNAERAVPGVDASRDELLPFVAPPPTVALWSLVARLPYVVAANLWCALLVIAAIALAAVVARASAARSTFAFLTACALAIAFGPVTSDVALGQVALLAFLAAVLATLPMGLLPRTVACVAAFVQPNVAVGLVAMLGRNRATVALASGALVTYAIGASLFGLRWPIGYAAQLAAHAHAERFGTIQLTPGAIAYGLGVPPAACIAIAVAFGLTAVLALVALWRRIADPFARFAAVAPLAPFVTTFFHEHDLVVAYAAAGWCAFRTRGAARALALGATLLVAIDWLGVAQRPSGIAQSALLAAAAACAFAALGSHHELRSSAVAIGTTAALFAAGAWLATTHPAPVWPDALGAFHASPNASVAGVWAAEQQRTGLLAIEPVWALLRTLPLLGCALLGYCVLATSVRRKTRRARRQDA
jgi:hypothetical protein